MEGNDRTKTITVLEDTNRAKLQNRFKGDVWETSETGMERIWVFSRAHRYHVELN